MKRKIFAGIVVVLAALVASFCGCAASAPDEMNFKDFGQYQNFDKALKSIEVKWDNGGSYTEFSIGEEKYLNEIVKLFNGTKLHKGDSLAAGDNHSISFVYENAAKKAVSLFCIMQGESYYYYDNTDVRDYIRRVGVEKGALEK